MVKFEYKYDDLTSVWIHCTNCNIYVHFQTSKIVWKEIIPVFIKVVVFHHVYLSWMIQTKYQIQVDGDEYVSNFCRDAQWYNATFFTNYMALYLNISL